MGMSELDVRLDARMAAALRSNLQTIAQDVMDTHDAVYPDSKLRSVPFDERRRWVEQSLAYIIRSIEENRATTWKYSYQPNIMGGFDPQSPPYIEILNCYETILSLEDCMLPVVWAAFSSEQKLLLPALQRFRLHIRRFIDANAAAVGADVARQTAYAIEKTAQRERDHALQQAGDYLADSIASVKAKLNLVYDCVLDERNDEALALLTATKLLLSDAAEQTLALRRGRAFGFSVELSRSDFDANTLKSVSSLSENRSDAVAERLDLSVADTDKEGLSEEPTPKRITKREHDVLLGIVEGKTNTEIAADLELSVGTVRNYASSLLEKLQAENRTQLAVRAVKAGLVR